MTIGITGGTGAGKTTALKALCDLGAYGIDCDALYHGLLARDLSLQAELDARFPGCLRDGAIDTKRLGALVFADEAALSDLNRITHRYILSAVSREIEREKALGRRHFAIDAVALIESGLGQICDLTVAVTAPKALRAQRIVAREGITLNYAQLRIEAQQPDAFYLENCDVVLENNEPDAAAFYRSALEFFKKQMEE